MNNDEKIQIELLKNREVTQDKWKVELNTKEFSDISISWIGYMAATPTQFFTNYFPRKDYCLQYVVRGKGYFFSNNKLYTLEKGSLWLLPKNEYHYYISDKDDPYEYYWLHLDGSSVLNFLNAINISDDNPVIDHLLDPNIEKQFNRLISVSKEQTPNQHLILSSLHSLLYEIENARLSLDTKKNQTEHDDVIDTVILYIKSNYAQNITLQDLATVVHLDKMYLIKKFKAKTELTPIQFLIQYRISQSCNMMYSDMPIADIALQCGFNNVTNYFLRFKDFLGISPSQYRKKYCRNESKNKNA